jgi:hypothetical protein
MMTGNLQDAKGGQRGWAGTAEPCPRHGSYPMKRQAGSIEPPDSNSQQTDLTGSRNQLTSRMRKPIPKHGRWVKPEGRNYHGIR